VTTETPKTPFSEKLFKTLLDGAVIITLATALLYIMGRAVSIGQFSYWGIHDGFFEHGFRDTVYLGFLVLNVNATLLIMKTIAWIVGIYFAVRIYIYLIYKFRDSLKAFVEKFENKFESKPKVYTDVIDDFNRVWFQFGLILLVILGFALLTSGFVKIGKEYSRTAHEKYQDFSNNKYFIKDYKRFYLHGCNDFSCMVYFPINDTMEIVKKEWLIGAKKQVSPIKEKTKQEKPKKQKESTDKE